MQTVTNTYDAYRDYRRVNAKVSFGVVAPEASWTAQHSSSPGAVIAQLGQTHNSVEKTQARYASLEPDLWRLDGGFTVLPDDTKTAEVGWWSDPMSDEQGSFEDCPFVRYDFTANQKSFGFTVSFDSHLPEEYVTELEVSTFDETGVLIERKTFYPNAWRYVLDMPTQGYRGVLLVFRRTKNPFRRVRLAEFLFGVIYEYEKGSIKDLQLERSLDPTARALPAAELSVTVDNANRLYNMANPAGAFAYLQERQPLDVQFSIDGEIVKMGRVYFAVSESSDGALTSTITAYDALMQLEGQSFYGGRDGTWLLADAVKAILNGSGLHIEVVMPEECNVTIRSSTPKRCTRREALRLACQAACCTCYIDRQNRLVFIKPSFSAPLEGLTRDHMAEEAQIGVRDTYNAVRLIVRNEYTDREMYYFAQDVATDDSLRIDEVDNALAYDGQAVADWLLLWHKRRTQYLLQTRGNPALESLDCVRVFDSYGENNTVMVTGQRFAFDGGLDCEVEGLA